MLEDIRLGRVQIIVVYKIDRLTRSLTDFAKLVEIFEAYLKLGSASKVKSYLQELGIRTPPREHRNGKTSGDKHFTTGHLYQILSNPVYIGKVRHHGKIYHGQHEAILNQNLWDQVQNKLVENAVRPKGTSAQRKLQYPLVGKIFSSTGYRLAPTTVHKPTKANQKNYYRHYTVNRTRREPPYGELTSLPAQEAEQVTSLALQKLLADLKAEQSDLSAEMFLQIRQEVLQLSLRELTETVVLYKDRLVVTLSQSIAERLGLTKPACCSYPIKPRSVGKRNKVILSNVPQNTPNQELILCVAKSWKWYQALSKGKVRSVQELAAQEKTSVETVTRNLPLATLNPDQIEKLLTGHHAPDLSVAKLLADPNLI